MSHLQSSTPLGSNRSLRVGTSGLRPPRPNPRFVQLPKPLSVARPSQLLPTLSLTCDDISHSIPATELESLTTQPDYLSPCSMPSIPTPVPSIASIPETESKNINRDSDSFQSIGRKLNEIMNQFNEFNGRLTRIEASIQSLTPALQASIPSNLVPLNPINIQPVHTRSTRFQSIGEAYDYVQNPGSSQISKSDSRLATLNSAFKIMRNNGELSDVNLPATRLKSMKYIQEVLSRNRRER
jgi:hypothetical protein